MSNTPSSSNYAPGGFREFFAIAYPLVVSNASFTVMTFVDRLFLSWSSPEEIAATLPANLLALTVTAFFLGVSEYTNTFVAQFYGAGRFEDVGRSTWQGFWIASGSGFVSLLFLPLGPWIFRHAGHNPDILRLEVIYYSYLLFATVFHVINASLSSFYSGRGKTKVVMLVSLFANLVNCVLDYGLIFGVWGLPRWGIKGAAVATLIANILTTVLYLILFLSPENNRKYKTRHSYLPDMPLLKRILRFGAPSGMEFLLSISSFTVFLLMIGRLGLVELAATNIVISLNMLAFFPMIGATIATASLVGRYIGRGDHATAEKSAYTALYSVQAYMMMFALIYILFPEQLIRLFHQPDPSTDALFDEIMRFGTQILFLVAVYQVFDSLFMTFAGALRGAGDTSFAMWASVVLAWILFVPGTWIVLHVLHQGVISAWIWATVYISLNGIVYWLRFRTGFWKTIHVIPIHEDYPIPLADRRLSG